MIKDTKNRVRILVALLGGSMLGIIGLPHRMVQNSAGTGQALQGAPQIQRTALQSTDEFGKIEKQALQRINPAPIGDDQIVAAWYDGNSAPASPVSVSPAEKLPDRSLDVAGTPSGNSPVAELPLKSLNTVAWADPVDGDPDHAVKTVGVIQPSDLNGIVNFPA